MRNLKFYRIGNSEYSKKKIKIYCLLIISFLLVLLGGLIYLNFRPHNLLMFSWLRNIGLENLFQYKRIKNESKIIEFCIYSLPNALWCLSCLILFGLFWKNDFNIFLFYSISFVFISILFEFFQLLKIISGTFDFTDLGVLLISLLLGILIYRFIIKEDC